MRMLHLLQTFDVAWSGYKIFQVERFEVCHLLCVQLPSIFSLCQLPHILCKWYDTIDETGFLGYYNVPTLVRTVTEEIYSTILLQFCLESMLIHHFCLDFIGTLQCVWRIECRIDFHTACVQHRTEQCAFFYYVQCCALRFGCPAQHLQCVYRNQGYIQAVAQPFGGAGSYAQTCITARTLRQRHRIQMPPILLCLIKQFADEYGQFAGVIGTLQVLTPSHCLAVYRDGGRATGCRSLYIQNSHTCYRFLFQTAKIRYFLHNRK